MFFPKDGLQPLENLSLYLGEKSKKLNNLKFYLSLLLINTVVFCIINK